MQERRCIIAFTVALSLSLAGAVGAQISTLFEIQSVVPSNSDRRGVSVGDVNGDGYGDFALTGSAPGATIFSGYDASVLLQITSSIPFLGQRCDGRDGYLVLANDYTTSGTYIQLFNCVTGAMLISVQPEYVPGNIGLPPSYPLPYQHVALLDDMDGDGVPEVAFANTIQLPIRIVSGATGAVIQSGLSGSSNNILDLRRIDDIDGDGISEIGWAIWYPGGYVVCNPVTGGLLAALACPSGSPGPSSGPVDLGDVNGNGLRDFLVATSCGPTTVFEMPNGGSPIVYTVPAPSGSEARASAVGDFDSDGITDFAIDRVIPNSNATAFTYISSIHSGATGGLIQTFSRSSTSPSQMSWCSFGGDICGNGSPTIILAEQNIGYRILARPYPGSGEDVALATGVDAAPTTAAIKLAAPGQSIVLDVSSPLGANAFLPVVLGAQVFYTGSPVGSPTGFPEVHMRPYNVPFPVLVLFDGNQTPLNFGLLPPSGFALAATVPPGFAGLSAMIQAFTTAQTSANGIFAVTDGHEIRFL